MKITGAYMKQRPRTLTIKELTENFTPEQKRIMEAEVRYYDLLFSFRDAREKKGVTQEELARRANINRTTLSQVESGGRNATVSTVIRIARALDMDLELCLR
jgi:DNA-binding XRE family transcriptional regulator